MRPVAIMGPPLIIAAKEKIVESAEEIGTRKIVEAGGV